MLADVEPIVGCVHHVRVVEHFVILKTGKHSIDQVVYGLETAKAKSVVIIVVIDVFSILSRQLTDPTHTTRLESTLSAQLTKSCEMPNSPCQC